MPNDFDKRLTTLEGRFEDFIAMFYRWLDELRTDHEISKRKIEQNQARIEQNEAEFREYMLRTDSRSGRQEETLRIVLEIQEQQGNLLSRLASIQVEQGASISSISDVLAGHGKILARILNTQDETVKLLDRMNQKLDQFGSPTSNGAH